MKHRSNLLLVSLIAIAFSHPAQAGSLEWKGSTTGLTGGTNNTWDTNITANWWNGSATINWPALGGTDDDAVFGGTAGTVTITTATANDILFNTTGYTLTGGTLTLNGTTPIITNGTGIDATIASKISGAAGLTKAGDGVLTLSGANDYTGGTVISAGTVIAQNSAAFGAAGSSITVNSGAAINLGGTMAAGGLNQGTRVFTVSGTGVGGTGVLTSTATNTQINAISKVVLAGDATFGGSQRWDVRGNTPTLNMAGYTLTKTGTNYIALVGVAVTADNGANTGDIIIDQGELNLTQATSLGGDADNTVTINNGGKLSLYQSASAHAWTLNLNSGSTLRGENGTAVQNIWAGAVNANGNFTLLAESGHNLTVQGNISGTGGLTKTGIGTAYLTGNNSSWSGGLTISAGSLQVNSANSLGTSTSITTSGLDNAALVLNSGVTAGSGKTITIAGGGASQFYGALSANGTGTATWEGDLLIGAATGTRLGTLSTGTLVVTGDISETVSSTLNIRPNSGTVLLSGNNTYTGSTAVAYGTLQLGSATAIGSGTLILDASSILSSDGATARTIANNLQLNSNTALGHATNSGKLTFTGTTALGGADRTFTVNSAVEISNTISATGAFGIVKAGGADLILSGSNDFAGTVTVSAGNLILSNSNSFAGTVTINGGKLVAGHVDAMGPAPKTINVNAGGTLELATDSVVPTYSFNTGSGGTGTIVLNRATAGAALTQDFTTYALGNSTVTFEAGANVTSGTPTVNIPTAVYTAGVTGIGYTKLNPNGVNLNIGTLSKTGNQSAVRLGGTSTGNIITGVVSGAYSLTKEDSGTWDLAGANTYTGATTVSNGKLIFSGDRTVAMGGGLTVGNTAGQTGILDIKGDLAMGANSISVGSTAAGAVGIVNHSDGDVTLTGSSNALLIGGTTGGVSGTYNLSGGKLTPYSGTASRGVMIGVNAGSAGNLINATFNLSGTGVLDNSTGSGVLQVVRGDAASSYQNSTYNQTGGTSTNKVLLIGGNGASGANSIATFSVTGGMFSATSFTGLSAGNSVSSTLTIGGTADVTLPAFPTTRGTGSTATLYFDGGVLKPKASSTSYLGGLTNAYINGGGAKFNTSGFDITVSQNLLAGTGSGGLTKEGAGILTLSGASTYTGGTTISAGTLSAGNIVVSGGNSGLGNATSRVVLGSAGAQGRLSYTGNSATYIRGFTLGGAGGGGLDVTTSGQTLTVDTVGVDGTGDLTIGGAGNTTIKGIVSHTGSIIKTGAGTMQLNLSSSTTPLANTFTGGASILAGTLNLANALGGGGQLTTPGGDVAGVYYLGDTTGTAGATLSIGNNNIIFNNPITVRSGSSGTKTFSISGSSVTGSNSGTITLDDNLTLSTAASSSTLALSGVIQDGINGAKGITVSGSGQVTVSNTNTYNGTTTVSGGTLLTTTAAALPGYNSVAKVLVNGGTLALRVAGSGWTGSEVASLVDNATKTSGNLAIDTTNGNFTPTSALDIGALGLVKNGGNTLTLDQANSFAGNVTVNAGTLKVADSGALGTGSKTLYAMGGSRVVQLSGGVTLGNNISLSMSSNSGDGLGLSSIDGDNEIQGDINYTSGNPALNISSSGTSKLTISGNLTYTVAGNSRVLYLGGDSAAANTISGNVGQSGAGAVLTVYKQGTGTWELGGTNSYTGDTQVNGGTLVVSGDISTSITAVNNGGRLAGTGITGEVSVANGGTLAPGNSAGTLAVSGNLGLNDTSILDFELHPFDYTLGGGINDLVNITGNLSLNGLLKVTATSGSFDTVTSGSWRLFNYSGDLTDQDLRLMDGGMPQLASGYSWSLDTKTSGRVNLMVVPEPRALLLGGLGVLLLLRGRRR